jgi:hypothetical protein
MKYSLLFSVCLSLSIAAGAQQGVGFLKMMHAKNYGHWYKTMTFVQTTEHYRNDSLIRKATWYEALKLPYDLRIDIEDPAKGNFILYKKDSSYRFQNNKLRSTRADVNPFLFFIGGMYYMPFDSVLQELKRKGYDVSKGYKTEWKGIPSYVVGRANEGDSSNAVWIDMKNLWFVRMVEKDKGQTIDAHMTEHLKLAKGTTETRVEIFLNGKLLQVESYADIKADVPLDDALFDPVKGVGAKHWHQ